jgi:hypothetical protein
MISVISVISVLLMRYLLRTPFAEPYTQLITDIKDSSAFFPGAGKIFSGKINMVPIDQGERPTRRKRSVNLASERSGSSLGSTLR